MAKSDLAARPIYHRTKDSIQAHLTIVFAALAVSHWIEHVITAADPLPDDVHQRHSCIKRSAHPN
jgi:hypothetical protein